MPHLAFLVLCICEAGSNWICTVVHPHMCGRSCSTLGEVEGPDLSVKLPKNHMRTHHATSMSQSSTPHAPLKSLAHMRKASARVVTAANIHVTAMMVLPLRAAPSISAVILYELGLEESGEGEGKRRERVVCD